jgi:hypothetical protein
LTAQRLENPQNNCFHETFRKTGAFYAALRRVPSR